MKNFTNTNNSKKHESYNIFNDLMEYEVPETDKNNSDNESDDSDYLYSKNSEYVSTNLKEDTNFFNEDIIKYPEKEKNKKKEENIPEKEENEFLNDDFPPLGGNERKFISPNGDSKKYYSNSYPPGLEHFNSENTFKLLQKNDVPIVFSSHSTLLKKSINYYKKPYYKNNVSYPIFLDKSRDSIFNQAENSYVDKSQRDYDKSKGIPTKKFTFGNIKPYDMKTLKCIKSFGIILFTKNNILSKSKSELLEQNKNWRNEIYFGKGEPYSSDLYTNKKNELTYLIYQRRDTYGFMDFMRGLWNDDKKMFFLLSMISKDERKRLLNYNFDELWEDLWMSHSPDPTGIYIAGRERARKKFNMVREKVLAYLNDPNNNVVCDSPWGFPKGKKNSREGDIECAKREFFEETKIDPSNINILPELGTIIERYVADNDKYYTTFYYIAETSNILPIKHMPTPGCIRTSAVSDEVANLIWATYSDSSLLLDDQKRCILEEAHSRIMNYINQ